MLARLCHMKSKLVSKNSEKKVILSIGMIVKNEEKVLERCLESLRPLRDAIECELIIADTGSTDSTVEIAKRYTDNVYHFDWNNDFSAARNSTLERARGIWYLFIDADEYFDEDIEEILSFFNNPNIYLNTYSAFITVRSYIDSELTRYGETELPRFHRINYDNSSVRFVGAVHESIPFKYPNAKFSSILHHTGYVYVSEQQSTNKTRRNTSLMIKEIEKSPEDARMLSHIIRSNLNNNEKEKYVKIAYDLVKKKNETDYENALFLQIIDFYMYDYPDKSLEICNSLEIKEKYSERYLMDISIRRAKCLGLLYRFDEAILEYEKYFEWYEKECKNKSVVLDITGILSCIDEKIYWDCIYNFIVVLKQSGKSERLFSLLNRIDYKKIDDKLYYSLVELILTIYYELNDLNTYTLFLKKFIDSANDINKVVYINKTIENAYYSFSDLEKRKSFAKKISEFDIDNEYVSLMKLIINGENENIDINLMTFMKNINDWRYGYSESIYIALRNRIDISEIVDKIDSTLYRTQIECISCYNDDYAECVLRYGVPESYYVNMNRFNWIVMVYEVAVYRAFNLNTKEKYKLFYTFSRLIGDFVCNLYNPDLLNEDDICILPPLHRFGYYLYKSNEALDAGDKIKYIKCLKKALLEHEEMKEVIKILLMRFKEYYT